MGAGTAAPPKSARQQVDDAHANLGDDAQSRATEHPDAKAAPPAEGLPDGLELEAGGQLSLEVGGKRPTAATLTLTGGKVQLPKGQFAKGDRIVVRVEATVRGVKLQDQVDSKTRQVVGCERQHFAPIENVTLVNANEDAAAKAPAPKVDRSQALGRVIAVLNEQSMVADEFVADQLVSAVLGS
jgi:hypothetical protein